MMSEITQKTIDDFGEQWSRYPTNEGYYASDEIFADICGPLLSPEELGGKQVAEIGSGPGRIVNMLISAGASHVIAIEPSEAFSILKRNTEESAEKIEYLHATGEHIPADRNLDYVFSIGVLHHIAEPDPVVRAALQSLRPGGRFLAWLYGWENNEAYLRIVLPLRRITTRLPAPVLAGISHVLNALLSVYVGLCRYFPLPLRGYMTNVFSKFSRQKRFLAIYDQLNPRVAKYYKEDEAKRLLEDSGFVDVQLYHRHGYSWTVIGTRPGP